MPVPMLLRHCLILTAFIPTLSMAGAVPFRSQPLEAEVSSCSSFTEQEVIRSCNEFRQILDTGKQYKKYRLITDSETFNELLEKADGSTAFFLLPQDYQIQKQQTLSENIALIGVKGEDGRLPRIAFGNSFQQGEMSSWFVFQLNKTVGTSIFSQLNFDPVYSEGSNLYLQSILMNRPPYQVNNLVLHGLNFNSTGMKEHPFRGFVELAGVQGQVSVTESSMDLSQTYEYAVSVGCLQAQNCNAEVSVLDNVFSNANPAGALYLLLIDRFTIQGNQISVTEPLNSEKHIAWQPGAFQLTLSGPKEVVQGLLADNRVSGQQPGFLSYNLVLDQAEQQSPQGDIYFFRNSWSQLVSHFDSERLGGVKLHQNTLPPSLQSSSEAMSALSSSSFPAYITTTYAMSSRQGLPFVTSMISPSWVSSSNSMLVSSTDMDDFTSDDIMLTTEFIDFSSTISPSTTSEPGEWVTSMEPPFSDSSEMLFTTPYIEPSRRLIPSSMVSSVWPASTLKSMVISSRTEKSAAISSTMTSTSSRPTSSVIPVTSESSASTSTTESMITQLISSTEAYPESSSDEPSTFFPESSTLMPSQSSYPPTSYVPPSSSPLPTATPEAGSDSGLAWKIPVGIGGGLLATEAMLISICVYKYRNTVPSQIPFLWKLATIGSCVCILNSRVFGGSAESGGQSGQSLLQFTEDNDQ